MQSCYIPVNLSIEDIDQAHISVSKMPETETHLWRVAQERQQMIEDILITAPAS